MNQIHICKVFDSGLWTGRSEDWRIKPNCDSILYLKNIVEFLTTERLQTVSLDEVISTSEIMYPDLALENCPCCRGVKHKLCDITKPIIVVHGMPNPYNKKYKVIDGKHRLFKMRSQQIMESEMYVLEFDEIEHLFEHD